MARKVNRLNSRSVATINKPGRHADGNGLYLNVSKTGGKSWVFMYDIDRKRREMGLGSARDVSLADARQAVAEQRLKLNAGIDPLASDDSSDVTFSSVATDLIESLKSGWRNEKHSQQWKNTLMQHAAALWNMPVAAIGTDNVVAVLLPIWTAKPETATRVRGRIERVMDAAKVRGLRSGENPARWKGHLEILLPKRKIKPRHHTALPYKQLPAFLADLRKRPALAARALEFLILTAARTSEVIEAEWAEFHVANRLWTVPASRMKADKEHRVPLAPRCLEILAHVKFNGGNKPFPMSNMAMANLMNRMEYGDYTVHGFRSSFRDWVGEETEFPRELAEAALAHQVGNAVERAYRRGDALDKRREMMEAWEAFLSDQAVG